MKLVTLGVEEAEAQVQLIMNGGIHGDGGIIPSPPFIAKVIIHRLKLSTFRRSKVKVIRTWLW